MFLGPTKLNRCKMFVWFRVYSIHTVNEFPVKFDPGQIKDSSRRKVRWWTEKSRHTRDFVFVYYFATYTIPDLLTLSTLSLLPTSFRPKHRLLTLPMSIQNLVKILKRSRFLNMYSSPQLINSLCKSVY